jgi:tRNA 2-selenouridine synthase
MPVLPSTVDYQHLFLHDVPMMDVRAPVEFGQGAFPCAVNVPLLDDRQRELIGIEYKNAGQDAAIALGNRLATPEIRAQRIADWQAFAQAHPDGVLYCFRGGLRSRTTQQWLHDSGAFGYTTSLQPPQIGFENALAVQLLKHAHRHPQQPLFLEDESRLIGRVALPPVLQEAMKAAPVIVLEAPLEQREERVVRDYIQAQRAAYDVAYGEQAAERFAEFVLHNLDRIRSRLGGERHQQLREDWQQALQLFEATGDTAGFRPGIRRLLVEYYDPMYDYQLSRRSGAILARGEADLLLQAMRQHYS